MADTKTHMRIKQHTPIIHFQHDQKGATLRASELKPKVDKFIINDLETVAPALFERYKELIEDEDVFPHGNRPVPSKYKLAIKAEETDGDPLKFGTYISRKEEVELRQRGIRPISRAPYFGDCCAVKSDNVTVMIFSFNNNLTNLVRETLRYVLAYNNFGTRQSKGFGVFLPEDMTLEELKGMLGKKYDSLVFQAKSEDRVFETINTVWQLLKSGLNFPDYQKSKLFEYMCGKDITWEKRKIKETLKKDHSDVFRQLKHTTNQNRIQSCETDHPEYRYVRALLGLAENNEYMTSGYGEKVLINIKDPSDEVQRYRSPVTFKVFGKNILMLIDEIAPAMFNREFEFSLTVTEKSGGRPKTVVPNAHLFKLKTPAKFNLLDFLREKLTPAIKFAHRR